MPTKGACAYFSLEDAFAKHLSRSAIAAHSSHILVFKINNINERSQETVGGVNRSLRRTSRSANLHSVVIFLLSPHLGCYTVDSAIKDPALFKHTFRLYSSNSLFAEEAAFISRHQMCSPNTGALLSSPSRRDVGLEDVLTVDRLLINSPWPLRQ